MRVIFSTFLKGFCRALHTSPISEDYETEFTPFSWSLSIVDFSLLWRCELLGVRAPNRIGEWIKGVAQLGSIFFASCFSDS